MNDLLQGRMVCLHAHLQMEMEGVIMGGNLSERKLRVSNCQRATDRKFVFMANETMRKTLLIHTW